MEVLIAIVVAGLYGTGLYLLMRRSLVKLIIGLVLLGHASNLLIFVAGGLTRARPPLVLAGMTQPEPGFANPLPQALILTAIVIGFGVLAFALVLVHRSIEVVGSDDPDSFRTTDQPEH